MGIGKGTSEGRGQREKECRGGGEGKEGERDQVEIDGSHDVVIRPVDGGNLGHALFSDHHQPEDGKCDSPSRYRK